MATKSCFIEEKPGNARKIAVNNYSECSSLCTIDMLELKIAPQRTKKIVLTIRILFVFKKCWALFSVPRLRPSPKKPLLLPKLNSS